MCGIIAGVQHGNILPTLLHGLRELEYRGYDSAGAALHTQNGLRTVKTAGKIAQLEALTLAEPHFAGSVGIAHTRWATHGAPDTRNAHPHSSMHGRFVIVHNGIIENAKTLRTELQAKGYVFASETDTEVIANCLEQADNGDPFQTLQNVCRRLQGSYALCVLYADAPGTVYCARCASPLLIGVSPNGVYAASDPAALDGCKSVFRMGEREFALLDETGVSFADVNGNTLQKTPEAMPRTRHLSGKGYYPTYLEKEISEQPFAVAHTLAAPWVLPDKCTKRIYLAACGSAYHAAMLGGMLLQAYLHIPCTAVPASEFRYSAVPLESDVLVILISQSGETADTLAALRKAKAQGAQTISIVNSENSSLAVESHYTFLTRAGREISVATTKAYNAQLAALLRMVCRWADGTELLRDAVRELPQKLTAALQTEAEAKRLAEKYRAHTRAYFIGRGLDYPSAMEGALKLRELAYVDAHAYPAGELKHGTISLIEPGTLCVAVCCMRGIAEKTISNIAELRARGANVLCITTPSLKDRIEAEDFLLVPDAEDALLPSLCVVPMQFFACFSAKYRNCDIDQPRNLAKSVTVE